MKVLKVIEKENNPDVHQKTNDRQRKLDRIKKWELSEAQKKNARRYATYEELVELGLEE
jgi:hypothetical protein